MKSARKMYSGGIALPFSFARMFFSSDVTENSGQPIRVNPEPAF